MLILIYIMKSNLFICVCTNIYKNTKNHTEVIQISTAQDIVKHKYSEKLCSNALISTNHCINIKVFTHIIQI